MKRILCLFLVAVCLLGLLTGCQAVEEPAPTMDDNPNLSAADMAALPIANDNMTPQQLRQLAIDYMQLQTTFRWIPDMNVMEYPTSYTNSGKTLETDCLYGGIPYQTTGSGNLYRWMEYYDEETGIMALSKAFDENGGYGPDGAVSGNPPTNKEEEVRKKYQSFRALFNACSQSSAWGWARTINSVKFGSTCDITVYNGFIPVGCYTYGYDYEGKHYGPLEIDMWGEQTENNPMKYDTKDALRSIGSETMYQYYAQLKPGDCLVSGGHVVMVKEVYLFTGKDGNVNLELSAVTGLEQSELWTNQTVLDGVKYYQQGSDNSGFTFPELYKAGYLPFTFAEFLDENDPQDKKHLDYYNSYKDQLTQLQRRYTIFPIPDDAGTAAVEKGRVFANKESGDITAAQFQELVVGSNYLISDVFVTVTDAAGTQLLRNIYRNSISKYEVPMTASEAAYKKDADGNYLTMCAGLAELAGQGNTVTVTMQISTGELLTVFTGKLV